MYNQIIKSILKVVLQTGRGGLAVYSVCQIQVDTHSKAQVWLSLWVIEKLMGFEWKSSCITALWIPWTVIWRYLRKKAKELYAIKILKHEALNKSPINEIGYIYAIVSWLVPDLQGYIYGWS